MLSVILSMFLLLAFMMELAYTYYYTNKLYKEPPENLTKFEKQLSDIFYDGLEEDCIQNSWWVRNFNFIFVARYVMISLLISNLQYV